MEDKILIERLKRKDEKAFDKIQYKYAALVKYVAYDILYDIEDVNDICQITFTKFYQNIDNFKGGSLKYYLVQIAKNEAYMLLRSRNNETKYLSEKGYLDSSIIETLNNDIWLNIAKILTKEEFDVFILHFAFSFNFNEISKVLNKSKTRCHDIYKIGLNKVKKIMREGA